MAPNIVTALDNRNVVVLHLNYRNVFDRAVLDGEGLEVSPANRLQLEPVGLAGISDY